MAPNPKFTHPPVLSAAPAGAPQPPPTFPTATLGPVLSAAVTAVAAQTQAPVPLVAHHVLTLAAMAAQRLVSVRLPTGALRPVSCFFVSLVGTGEGRSVTEKLTVECARLWERAFEDEYPMRVVKHIDEGVDTGLDQARPLRHLGLFYDARPPCAEDRYRPYTRQAGLFARHPHDLVQPGPHRRAEAATLCALWNGKVLKPASASPVFPRLALHLVAAPRAGRAVLGDADLEDAGLLGRLLVAAPASRLGARTFRAAENDAPPPAFLTLLACLGGLYEKHATAHARVVGFSKDAAARWLSYAQEVEAAMAAREGSGEGGAEGGREGASLAPVRTFAVHLPEHAARLAAVVALMTDCGVEELSPAHLESGIALARFYADERLRLGHLAAPALSESEKEELLRDWLRRRPADQVVTLRDICRTGPKQIRDVETVFKLMRRMERLGFVQPSNDAFQGAAVPRRPGNRYAWRVESEADTSVASCRPTVAQA